MQLWIDRCRDGIAGRITLFLVLRLLISIEELDYKIFLSDKNLGQKEDKNLINRNNHNTVSIVQYNIS